DACAPDPIRSPSQGNPLSPVRAGHRRFDRGRASASPDRRSVTFEDRGTLFNERPCGFLMILGSSRLDLTLCLKIKQLGQAGRLGSVALLLHPAKGDTRAAR